MARRHGFAEKWAIAALGLVAAAMFSTTGEAGLIRVPADQGTIQEALDAALPGDTVLVAHGTYFENLFWPPTQAIKLYANEQAPPESTIISGTFAYLPVIRFEVAVGPATEIRCFIVENGSGDAGAGILCSAGASPTVTQNLFRNNRAALYGGGICCMPGSPRIIANTFSGDSAGYGGAIAEITLAGVSAPIIENNLIEQCKAGNGGGIYADGGATIKWNTIYGCTGDGAGLYLGGTTAADSNVVSTNIGRAIYCAGDVTVSNSQINFNSGGGIYVAPGAAPLIEANTIDWNTAPDGGGIYSDRAYPTIRGNKIRNNDVQHGIGGGLRIEYGAALIEHNKITRNTTTYEAAGIYVCGDSSRIEFNNISYNFCPHPGAGAGVFT